MHAQIKKKYKLVILSMGEVMDLVYDLRILTSQQVMTSSMVVPSAVYLNKKTS
jgi:dTDP-4-dehydrorhamnose 3,5-epimerase-like enzyme